MGRGKRAKEAEEGTERTLKPPTKRVGIASRLHTETLPRTLLTRDDFVNTDLTVVLSVEHAHKTALRAELLCATESAEFDRNSSSGSRKTDYHLRTTWIDLAQL